MKLKVKRNSSTADVLPVFYILKSRSFCAQYIWATNGTKCLHDIIIRSEYLLLQEKIFPKVRFPNFCLLYFLNLQFPVPVKGTPPPKHTHTHTYTEKMKKINN